MVQVMDLSLTDFDHLRSGRQFQGPMQMSKKSRHWWAQRGLATVRHSQRKLRIGPWAMTNICRVSTVLVQVDFLLSSRKCPTWTVP